MKKITIFIPIIFFLIIGFSFRILAESKAVSISTLSLPPVVQETIPGYGFIGELFKAVFEPYGYKVNIKIYPWARAFELSKMGETFDGIFPSIYKKEREAWFIYSEPIITSGFVLVTRKDTGITTYKSLDEFKDITIGVLRRGVTGSVIDTSDFKKQEGKDFEMNIQKLLGKRFDLVTGEYLAIMNIINTKFADKIKDLVIIPPPVSKVNLHLMISKKSPEAFEILKTCNQGIAQIKNNGTLKKLKLKYGIK